MSEALIHKGGCRIRNRLKPVCVPVWTHRLNTPSPLSGKNFVPVPTGHEDVIFMEVPMKSEKPNTPPAAEEAPALTVKIGGTTYLVHVRFSETSKETLEDKIKRLLKSECGKM